MVKCCPPLRKEGDAQACVCHQVTPTRHRHACMVSLLLGKQCKTCAYILTSRPRKRCSGVRHTNVAPEKEIGAHASRNCAHECNAQRTPHHHIASCVSSSYEARTPLQKECMISTAIEHNAKTRFHIMLSLTHASTDPRDLASTHARKHASEREQTRVYAHTSAHACMHKGLRTRTRTRTHVRADKE